MLNENIICFVKIWKKEMILILLLTHDHVTLQNAFTNADLISWFIKIVPNPKFLSDVAAFEAVIIAFLIPLSIEIISKISERYQSEIIIRSFNRSWYNIVLPPFLLINIVFAIILRFLVRDDIESVVWKILAWIVLFALIITAFAIWKVICRIKVFMSDTKYVIDLLNSDVNKSMKKRPSSARIDLLIQSFEGIGDILVFETKRQKNKLVLSGLKIIRKYLNRIFEEQKDDPDRFEQLVFSQAFLDSSIRGKKEHGLHFSFDSDDNLIGFSTPINQIVRVYEAAINSQNKEISRFSVFHIIWILTDLSRRKNNELFLEQILQKLVTITTTSYRQKDSSAYAAAIHWYPDIVFNTSRNNGFDLSYLNLFDKYFFRIIKYIVDENATTLFHALVSYLIDGIIIPDDHQSRIWDYAHTILNKDIHKYNEIDRKYGLERKIKELTSSEEDLHEQNKLDAWLNKFNELKNVIEPNMDEEQRTLALEHEKKIIISATIQFKYQNLLDIFFTIGSYCLFKKRYNYIKYLWEYNQPSDSDATWIGHDISPRSLDEVIGVYFRKGLFSEKFVLWEGHHGIEKYTKQYFLLLICRILQSASIYNAQIDNYRLPDLHVSRLSDLKQSVDGLISIADELKQSEDIFIGIEFDTEKLSELFDDKLVPLLYRLKEEAEKQISAKCREEDISKNKIKEFKKDFLFAFYENAALRDLFTKYLNLYIDKTREKSIVNNLRFGTSTIDEKALFFDEWHVNYLGGGNNYGRNLAYSENLYIFNALAKGCKEITNHCFETALSKFENPNDIIILATNISFWRSIENTKFFKPKWHKNTKKLDIKGFSGWYDYNGYLIPVLKSDIRKKESHVLILNKLKLGQLVQFSPLNEGEREDYVDNIFYISVQALSENESMIEKFIKNPPEWLNKVGDSSKMKNYLFERVIIQAYEKFEFRIADDFEGYKLFFDNRIC